MKSIIQLKTTTRPLLVALAFLCSALVGPNVQAVVPPPDGGYPGGNTAEGQNALLSRTTGGFNTAVGWFSLESLTTGSFNTGVGAGTLVLNTGDENTATGVGALLLNTNGGQNTANGALALFNNTEGADNTAIGAQALYENTTGGANNAVGALALFNNLTGLVNNAHGNAALFSNTSGFGNNAFGDTALANNVTGDQNIAIGDLAGFSITGDGNVCIGAGVPGVAGENNTTRIRNVYQTVQPAVGVDPDFVTVNSSNRLGRGNVSSRRYKHDIKLMDKASEALFALKPVSFRYKKEFDPTQTIAFGLIAEEVAEVYPDLVGRNPEGHPESVRYEQINAMLLNEFLKEHKKVQDLEGTVASLVATVKEQAAQIQKVSDQLELSNPAPQTVVSNP